jgi:hypothetical protein
MLRKFLWVLWPSFVVGGMAEMVFFALFDPDELSVLWRVLPLSRTGVYSIGFFLFWGFCALSSAVTLLLQHSGEAPRR